MPKLVDLTGRRFGRLVVIKRVDNDKCNKVRWLCQCDCEKEIIVIGGHLKSGNTKSCGCLQKEKVTKHGHYKDEIYRAWQDMKDRCTNPNNKHYRDYGGRGITVCKEWMDSPENFIKDMGEKWRPGLTIERTRNWEGYYLGNCKWVTIQQQQRNKRNNLYVPYKGKNRLLIELCEEHNMPRGVVWNRIYKLGWSIEEALTTPVRKYKKKS